MSLLAYAQVGFCLEEAVNSGMQDAVAAAGLRPLPGKDAKAEVLPKNERVVLLCAL
jgi:hypothetical protein